MVGVTETCDGQDTQGLLMVLGSLTKAATRVATTAHVMVMASWRLTSVVLWLILALLRLNSHVLKYEVDTSGSLCGLSGDLEIYHFSIFRLLAETATSRGGTQSFRSDPGETVYFLLLLCGNVSTNPGPVQYPCTVCSQCVKSNQRGVLCDSCGKWSHTRCVGNSIQI